MAFWVWVTAEALPLESRIESEGERRPRDAQRHEQDILDREERRSAPGTLLKDVSGHTAASPTTGDLAKHRKLRRITQAQKIYAASVQRHDDETQL